jgi:type IV pilus assembly protein PilA
MFVKSNRARRTMRGFTLIELLVVVLILSILMAVALPLYLNAVSDSEKKTCRANMQTIANAEQAYKVSSAGHLYTATIGNLPDLQAVPKCPSNGNYTVTLDSPAVGQFTVKCDAAGHGTFTPGVDSQ